MQEVTWNQNWTKIKGWNFGVCRNWNPDTRWEYDLVSKFFHSFTWFSHWIFIISHLDFTIPHYNLISNHCLFNLIFIVCWLHFVKDLIFILLIVLKSDCSSQNLSWFSPHSISSRSIWCWISSYTCLDSPLSWLEMMGLVRILPIKSDVTRSKIPSLGLNYPNSPRLILSFYLTPLPRGSLTIILFYSIYHTNLYFTSFLP